MKTLESCWIEMQIKTKDAVVQVFPQVMGFNWLVPFESPEQGAGKGSGFFIDDQGHFLTNYHVIEQAKNIQIQVPCLGRERLDTEIVGVCPERDLALLRVTDEVAARIRSVLGSIPFLPFGNSDLIKRGEEILALGYPLGEEHLKSAQGIVSGREYVDLNDQMCLQVTAPINDGNSGGPSINQAGEVIGINFAGVNEAQNIGFVIPISDSVKAIKNLYTIPLLRKQDLGAFFCSLSAEMAQYLKSPLDGGFYIVSVGKNSLLEKAGIRDGDVLYKVDGFVLDHFGEMLVPWSEDKVAITEILNRHEIGDILKLEIYRNGKKMEFSCVLDFDCVLPIRIMYPEFEYIDYEVIGGMVVMELALNHLPLLLKFCQSAEAAATLYKYYALKNRYAPVLVVTQVLATSSIDKLRDFLPGTLIELLNDQKVTTLKEFRDAVKKSKKSGYLTLRTQDKRVVVLPVATLLKEEERLSKLFLYQRSMLLEELR